MLPNNYLVYKEATLGTLSQLHPELRLMIWDFLLFESEERTPISLLSLMRCSKFFQIEIHPRLWNHTTHVHLLRTHGTGEQIRDFEVEISLKKRHHVWTFTGSSERGYQKYFYAFLKANTYNRDAKIRIDVYPPSAWGDNVKCYYRGLRSIKCKMGILQPLLLNQSFFPGFPVQARLQVGEEWATTKTKPQHFKDQESTIFRRFIELIILSKSKYRFVQVLPPTMAMLHDKAFQELGGTRARFQVWNL